MASIKNIEHMLAKANSEKEYLDEVKMPMSCVSQAYWILDRLPDELVEMVVAKLKKVNYSNILHTINSVDFHYGSYSRYSRYLPFIFNIDLCMEAICDESPACSQTSYSHNFSELVNSIDNITDTEDGMMLWDSILEDTITMWVNYLWNHRHLVFDPPKFAKWLSELMPVYCAIRNNYEVNNDGYKSYTHCVGCHEYTTNEYLDMFRQLDKGLGYQIDAVESCYSKRLVDMAIELDSSVDPLRVNDMCKSIIASQLCTYMLYMKEYQMKVDECIIPLNKGEYIGTYPGKDKYAHITYVLYLNPFSHNYIDYPLQKK